MGKHGRIGLLLGATACLLAIMVDWIIEELNLAARGDPPLGFPRGEQPPSTPPYVPPGRQLA